MDHKTSGINRKKKTMNTITMIRSNQPQNDLQLGSERRVIRHSVTEWHPGEKPVRKQVRTVCVWTEGRYQEVITVLPVSSNQ